MNLVLVVGITVFLGTVGGKAFQKLKIPQVIGYIVIGILLSKSVLGLYNSEEIEFFTPLINFILGIIGFTIGAELKREVFKKYGRSIYFVLFGEGVFAFLAVAGLVFLFTKELYLGLLLGAIASATDPASTVNVLWEYRAKGPLTSVVTAIVALDDALALIIYGLVSVYSKAMIAHGSFSLFKSIGIPLLEIVQCFVLGVIVGLILVKLVLSTKENEFVLSYLLGAVAFVVGLSIFLHLDLILSSMVLGATIANRIPKISEALFKKLRELTVPLYVFFFVVIGASLDLKVFFKFSIIGIIISYLVARSFGKIFGAMLGAFIGKAKKTVIKYSGLCLFTQGGVAMGLALSIAHNLSRVNDEGKEIGILIVSVVAATTFVVQLIGPFLVKFSAVKADEVGRNVTEEDIVAESKVSDFMRKEVSCIREDTSLDAIMQIVKERESYHFPVVDIRGELTGLITLGGLRELYREFHLDKIVLAKDVAVSVGKLVYQDQPLREAFDLLVKRAAEYLPVVENRQSKKVVGVIEYQPLVEAIGYRLMQRQQELDRK